jgi:hypothetical protein
VGKTVHCEQLAQDLGLKHLSVNEVAKERDCYETYDDERKSWVVDEDKVLPPFRAGTCFITDRTVAGCDRGRSAAGRLPDRLARVRSLSQVLD